jgi:hypothetical protein
MLTDKGFILLMERFETQAVDRANLERCNADLRRRTEAAEAETKELAAARYRLSEQLDAARAETQQLRRTFPMPMDTTHHVYIAFDPRSRLSIEKVADEAGDYANAGEQPYASLLTAPLNPRCYLTSRLGNLMLLRLPAAPTGELCVLDDIPF